MTTKINLNGQILDDAQISVFDHGFLFGDSIYEVMGTYKNKPYFLDRHLVRLKNSAREIYLTIPKSDEWFYQEIDHTLKAANNDESYIRIVITRGIGEIDIDPGSCGTPNILIYVTHSKQYPPHYYAKGIEISLVGIKRNPADALNPGIKTGNYLNNVLAKMEANRLGADDALMLNASGYLTECTTSNLFFVQEGSLLTPSLDCGILSGITREVVMQVARENGIAVEEGHWPPEVLEKASEIFLTGTLKHIMPVTRIGGKIVGDGHLGPLTKNLMRLYKNRLQGAE